MGSGILIFILCCAFVWSADLPCKNKLSPRRWFWVLWGASPWGSRVGHSFGAKEPRVLWKEGQGWDCGTDKGRCPVSAWWWSRRLPRSPPKNMYLPGWLRWGGSLVGKVEGRWGRRNVWLSILNQWKHSVAYELSLGKCQLCVRCSSEHFSSISWFEPHCNPDRQILLSSFHRWKNRGTKAYVPSSKSHSRLAKSWAWDPGSLP